MKIYDCQQGSQEWLDLHIGVPSGSMFARMVTEKTYKRASDKAIHRIACELAAEWMLGQVADTAMTQFMARGLKLEERAVAWYSFDKGVDVQSVGFVTLDDGTAGVSPDGLVGDDGGLEIKCPSAVSHVENLTDVESFADQYRAQCMGGMWVCDRQWWDLVSWHPTIPSVVVRIERDEEYIETLRSTVESVVARMNNILRTQKFKE